jgi:putative membrane protein
MKTIPTIAGLFGLGLAGWLLHRYGIGQILALLHRAGCLGLSAVIFFHLLQIACSAAGWRSIAASAPARPSLWRYGLLRLIREAVNNLLPVAQIGGQVAAARLLERDGMPLAPAIATTVADLTLELITQILFVLLGLGLLLLGIGGHGISGYVISGVIVASGVAAGFLAAQFLGLGAVFEAAVLRIGGALGWAGTAQVEGLHKALLACYKTPRPVLLGTLWHFMSWLLGGVEVCLALHVLGTHVGFGAGLIIESIGQALKSVGFAVPGALGVQEGGYIVVCALFNLSPEMAIALSLVKRLREVTLGIPGLIAWHMLEAQKPRMNRRIVGEAAE